MVMLPYAAMAWPRRSRERAPAERTPRGKVHAVSVQYV